MYFFLFRTLKVGMSIFFITVFREFLLVFDDTYPFYLYSSSMATCELPGKTVSFSRTETVPCSSAVYAPSSLINHVDYKCSRKESHANNINLFVS